MEKCEGWTQHSKRADDHLKKVKPKTDVHWCKCVHVLFFSTWCVALLIIRLHPPYNNLIKKQTIKNSVNNSL